MSDHGFTSLDNIKVKDHKPYDVKLRNGYYLFNLPWYYLKHLDVELIRPACRIPEC